MLTIRQENMSYNTALKLINMDRNISGMCKVVFEDEDVIMPVRPMLLQLAFWEIYRQLDKPVTTKQLFFIDPPFNEKIYAAIMQQIYTEVFDIEKGDSYFADLKQALWVAINNLDDFGNHELGEYVCGLSIIDLAEIRLDPKIREICDIDISEERGVTHIKQSLVEGEKALAKAISTEGFIKNDALYPFISTNCLKTSQLFQVMGSYGLRTEINDRVVKRPVYGSALSGLQDFCDMGFENLSARKNVYYAHDAIRMTQYLNREISIICSTLENKYPGYCGNDVLLPFNFDERIIDRCYGKYFILPDDPERKLMVLLEGNAEGFKNKDVLMYSPITCGHTNGICERCIGMLARNHTDGINIGITSSCNLISEAAQLVLSTKHVDSAIPDVYTVPEPANDWLHVGKNGIRFTAQGNKLLSKMELGITIADLNFTIGDLDHIKDKMNVPEAKYSEIHMLHLKNKATNVIEELYLTEHEKIPFLTTEFLLYIKNHMQTHVTMDKEIIWVDMSAMVDNPIPILRATVYNKSMMKFVNKMADMFKKEHLSKYKHAGKALQNFAIEIFERVGGANIFQLEVLLRSHMITSSTNMSIPVVKDPTNVRFGRTKQVIADRTISGQLAHEGHNKHFTEPMVYTTLKDQSVFDEYFSI